MVDKTNLLQGRELTSEEATLLDIMAKMGNAALNTEDDAKVHLVTVIVSGDGLEGQCEYPLTFREGIYIAVTNPLIGRVFDALGGADMSGDGCPQVSIFKDVTPKSETEPPPSPSPLDDQGTAPSRPALQGRASLSVTRERQEQDEPLETYTVAAQGFLVPAPSEVN